MANITILLVEDNNTPAFSVTLKRNGTAIDLSGATVRLLIKNAQTDTITNSSNQTCTVVTAASGIVSYQPETGDFPSEGRYIGEFKISYAGSRDEILHDRLNIIARKKAG